MIVFGGNSGATSSFRRRRMNGRIRRASRSRLRVSPNFSIGVRQYFTNILASPRKPGSKKSNWLQSSPRWFSSGVPVRHRRCRASIFLTTSAPDCGSSSPSAPHRESACDKRNGSNSAASRQSKGYVVSTTSWRGISSKRVFRSTPWSDNSESDGAKRCSLVHPIETRGRQHHERRPVEATRLFSSRRCARARSYQAPCHRPISRTVPAHKNCSHDTPSFWYSRNSNPSPAGGSTR